MYLSGPQVLCCSLFVYFQHFDLKSHQMYLTFNRLKVFVLVQHKCCVVCTYKAQVLCCFAAMFDDLLSATGSGQNATVTDSSGSVLEMIDIPSNIGNRVS